MSSGPSPTPRSGNIEYRLSWEACDSHYAAAMEVANGEAVWPRLTDEEWGALPWHSSQRIGMGDIHGQHTTLKAWADNHEQPIRNVRLERRPTPNPDDGWEST